MNPRTAVATIGLLAAALPVAPALAGRIVGKQGSASFDLDFAVTLPAQDAAAGMSCGRK